MISEWRSIRPVEINQYDITIAIEITMCNDFARDIHCDITMSNDVAMCKYHGITMHNDIYMNLFYYVFSALCLIMILLWVECNKNTTHPSDSGNIPTQTQLMCSPQTDQTLTCSCYIIP